MCGPLGPLTFVVVIPPMPVLNLLPLTSFHRACKPTVLRNMEATKCLQKAAFMCLGCSDQPLWDTSSGRQKERREKKILKQ